MELTLKQLVEKSESLGKLLNKELPIRSAYRLGRLLNAIKIELKEYDIHRNLLIKKYGKEKDGQFSIDPKDELAIESFVRDNEELMSVWVKIDSYNPISINELGDIKLSPIDLGNLEIFFIPE
jgi:hypothetical protein